MRRVAIILARGGSKRLPGKNIRPFHGTPILHYAISAARASGCFDEVLTSTDDPETTRLAIDGGCHRVIHRPTELADDHATTAAAMAHAVSHLLRDGALEQVCCLYPCTPMLQPADLLNGCRHLSDSGADYVVPVTTYGHAPQRMLCLEEGGRLRSVWPQFDDVRSQDLEPRYCDAGQWYWGRAQAWASGGSIYKHAVGLLLPRLRAIDIDTEEDWMLAEAVYAANHGGRP